MMATSSEHLCVVCGEGVGSSGGKLGIKGLTTFIAVFKKRADVGCIKMSHLPLKISFMITVTKATQHQKIQSAQKTNSAAERSESPFHHCGMDKTLSSIRL